MAVKCCYAQQTTETKEVSFKISYLYYTHDTLIALIDGGSNNGITMNMTGRCRSIYRKETGSSGYDELGFFRIVYVKGDTAAAIITLNKINSSKDSARIGDLITVNLNLPKKEYHSIYFDLALMNIQFMDNDRKKYITPRYIYQYDSKQLEDSLHQLIIKDAQNTYKLVKDLFKPTDDINKPMSEGRYKGKSTLQVLKDISPDDLKHFLQFVKSYPGKYIGNTWKSSETFATWALNKAPISSLELREELASLRKDKAAFNQYALQNKNSILSEGTVTSLGDESIDLIAATDYAKAKSLIDFGFEIANVINDTAGKAALLICRAEWYQYQEKYTEAVDLCTQAILLSSSCKDYYLEMQARFKKVFCLYKITKYNDARTAISEAAQRLETIKQYIKESNYLSNLRKRYDYAGWVDYDAGNYKNALTNFTQAAALSKSINTYQSKNDLASTYEYIGLTLNNQGLYKEAIPYFDSAVAIYKSFAKKDTKPLLPTEQHILYLSWESIKKVLSCMKNITASLK